MNLSGLVENVEGEGQSESLLPPPYPFPSPSPPTKYSKNILNYMWCKILNCWYWLGG